MERRGLMGAVTAGSASGLRGGLGSSFAATGDLILSAGLMLMGWQGWFVASMEFCGSG